MGFLFLLGGKRFKKNFFPLCFSDFGGKNFEIKFKTSIFSILHLSLGLANLSVFFISLCFWEEF